MDANELARACANALWEKDATSQDLGVELISIEPGVAVMALQVTDRMINGHGICHGGYIFTLANTAFTYASNTQNRRTLTQQCDITYLNPAHAGDRLVARAVERRRSRATSIYDISVTSEESFVIAEMRGLSRTLDEEIVPGKALRGALGAKVTP
jgi:acyl-CoA thioesterase